MKLIISTNYKRNKKYKEVVLDTILVYIIHFFISDNFFFKHSLYLIVMLNRQQTPSINCPESRQEG